mgnify:FL=1|tara:strand:+ start:1817 stop:2800 length:984 start_codon:yes stop_codon:yes gene_type:complete
MTIETVNYHEGHDWLTKEVAEHGRNVVDVASEVHADFPVEYVASQYTCPITGELKTPEYLKGNKRGDALNLYVLRTDGVPSVDLGLHSGRYPQRDGYKHVFETMETMFPNSCTDITVFGKGERIAITQQIGDPIEVMEGDDILPVIITSSSLNGQAKTTINAVGERVSCLNMLDLSKGLIQVKSTKNHDDLLTLRSALLEASKVNSDSLVTFARQLSSSTLSDTAFYRMLNTLLPEAEEDAATKTKNAIEAKRHAILNAWSQETNGDWGNGWLAYNAFQGAEQHRINQGFKSTTAAKQKGFEKVLDRSTPIADAAEQYLREQLLVGA